MKRMSYLRDVAREARVQANSLQPPRIPGWASRTARQPTEPAGIPPSVGPRSQIAPLSTQKKSVRDVRMPPHANQTAHPVPEANTVQRRSDHRDRVAVPQEPAARRGSARAMVSRTGERVTASGIPATAPLDLPSRLEIPSPRPRAAAPRSNRGFVETPQRTISHSDDREASSSLDPDSPVDIAAFQFRMGTPAHRTASPQQPSGRKVEIGTVEIVVAPVPTSPKARGQQTPRGLNPQNQSLSRGFATVLGLRQG
jgi:hypothetical protein